MNVDIEAQALNLLNLFCLCDLEADLMEISKEMYKYQSEGVSQQVVPVQSVFTSVNRPQVMQNNMVNTQILPLNMFNKF